MSPELKRESGRGPDLGVISMALVEINKVDEIAEGPFLNEKRRLRMDCWVAPN